MSVLLVSVLCFKCINLSICYITWLKMATILNFLSDFETKYRVYQITRNFSYYSNFKYYFNSYINKTTSLPTEHICFSFALKMRKYDN